MMEASLQQVGQVEMFSGAYESRNRIASKRAAAAVQVFEQLFECIAVKLDDGKFGLR